MAACAFPCRLVSQMLALRVGRNVLRRTFALPASSSDFRSEYSLDKLYPSQQKDSSSSSSSSSSNNTDLTKKNVPDIPVDRLSVSYCRSSGPGGQNVNKGATLSAGLPLVHSIGYLLERSLQPRLTVSSHMSLCTSCSSQTATYRIYASSIVAASVEQAFWEVNTKAEVRFHLASADWIAEDVREKMAVMHKNKISKSGELIITSEVSRYQMRNLADCLQKVRDLIAEATEKPQVISKIDAQIIRARVEKMNRERLRQKKIHSGLKQSRRVDFD